MRAPIGLFVYNRPWHTRQTIEALQKNDLAPESDLFIFADGPRTTDAASAVQEVRESLKNITGFKSVGIIERPGNLGLAGSIIEGVTRLCNEHGRVIILEDDMVTSPHFLRFMNTALDVYRKEDRVISIHGYLYPVKVRLPETFLLRGADCWGWATWKRGWDLFEHDGKKLLDEIKARNLSDRFDYDGSYPFTRMLEDQVKEMVNSWAIRWNATAFLKDRLTLYPGRSLVYNTGIDASGTHCGSSEEFATTLSQDSIAIRPIIIEEDLHAREAFKLYFRSLQPSLARRITRRVKEVFSKPS